MNTNSPAPSRTAMAEAAVAAMAERLAAVGGVRAVALGGSRARGTHRPDSDWDLGVYYRGRPDIGALERLAAEVTGARVEVAAPGGWGPWVNGGAWLLVDGVRVDWILRDLDRVESVWEECLAGRYEVGIQAGHPLGFWSPAYPGEVAHCRVLADPEGGLTALRKAAGSYPEALREALIAASWEAEFSVGAAAKSAGAGPAGAGRGRAAGPAGDPLHVSLCLSRAFGVLAQSLYAHHRRWCVNEKGALAAVAAMPDTPEGFAARVAAALRGADAEAVRSALEVVREVRSLWE
ncbi:nucleotidyltransferase domain-containing protein [Streptomyces sp. CAU 1734]|uniref:nucleotidyltransferase domain-containing protein n=1 Tax=Streptomyces sp. CAU 1734 TaxID=3140360 RepID=UPI0032603C89